MQPEHKKREERILEILYEHGNVSISRLSEIFSVTPVTIRKDLDRLESGGMIVRTHGGASPLYDKELMERRKSHADQKLRIAKAAAEMIADSDRVMISAGTTTSQIPKFLVSKRKVHIVTNSTLLLNYGRMLPSVEITMLGGEFMPEAEALKGSITLRELDMFHTDKAFIGCDGFSIEEGVSANHTELAEICRKIITRTSRLCLVADSSKFDQTGFAYIDKIENINTLITDTLLSAESEKKLRKAGVDVVKV